jgi:hypothetical protein
MSERQPAPPTAAAQAAAARGAVECVLAALLKHHRALRGSHKVARAFIEHHTHRPGTHAPHCRIGPARFPAAPAPATALPRAKLGCGKLVSLAPTLGWALKLASRAAALQCAATLHTTWIHAPGPAALPSLPPLRSQPRPGTKEERAKKGKKEWSFPVGVFSPDPEIIEPELRVL